VAGTRHPQIQHPQPGGQLPPVETVGLIHPLVGALVGSGVQEALPFIAHQGFEKRSVMFFHLRVEVFKKELARLLQSPPTGGRLYDEGCVGSHGCILSLVYGSFAWNRDIPARLFTHLSLHHRLRQETTMTLKWMADRLKMGTWTHVTNRLYHLKK
jgi:hypothetical protein